MKIAILGRSQALFDAAERLAADGHEIALVITAKEAPEYTRTVSDFEALAARHRAPFLRSARLTEQAGRIRELQPIDIAVSVNFPGIIAQPVIDCFRLGILNCHAGDLPRYRGNATMAWAIVNGEKRAALCVHRMVGGELDAGDIISRAYRDIDSKTTIGDLWDWLQATAPSLFAEALKALALDPHFVLERQSEDPADALRCYPRRPEDGRIQWRHGAEQIVRLINASGRPYPGAFFHAGEEIIFVHRAEEVADKENFLAAPGQVTGIGDLWVDVAAGDGRKVRLNEVWRAGEPIPAADLVRSIRERFS